MKRPRAAPLAALAVAALTGCGGAAPILHPAHPLPGGEASFGAGVSGQLASGASIDRADAARAENANGVAAGEARRRFLEGAAAEYGGARGVAPYVALRLGLGHRTEGGLSYTGRSARADARWAPWYEKSAALSVGLGVSALLARSAADRQGDAANATRSGTTPGVDPSGLSGFGFDVPLLIGWRSDANLVQLWAGPRLGVERLSGDLLLRVESDSAVQLGAPTTLTRWSVGGIVGFAVGLRPFQVALGLDLGWAYFKASTTVPEGTARTPYDASFGVLLIAPAGALIARF